MKLKTIAKGFMIFLAVIFISISAIIFAPYIEKSYDHINNKFRTYQVAKRIESENKQMNWQLLHDNLYQANDKKLAIKTDMIIADPQIYVDRYINHFGLYDEDEDNILLKNVIDINSFRQLTHSFYRDNNNLYQHYGMSDGGMFYIFQIDDNINNFSIVNECYAKDSKRIYHHRGSFDTSIFDYATFRTCADCCGQAKDKNGYYYFDDKIDIDEMINNPDTSIDEVARLKELKSL